MTEPRPMLAVSGTLPDDDAGWAYEMKWDGARVLLVVRGGTVRVVTRNALDATGRYPELAGLATALAPHEAVLDGEVVALDERSRPSFSRLQRRLHADPRAAPALAARVPVVVMLFDVLALDGRDTTTLPYRERRARLEALGLDGPHWQTPPTVAGPGAAVLAAASGLGLEGVMAKRLESAYRPGRRSSEWRKVKLARRQELVIGGWLPGRGRLTGTLGALLVGVHDGPGGPLRYAGRVGSGLSDATRADLARRLVERPDPPFSPAPALPAAHWTEPDAVAEVRFTEWTPDGVLRHPVFLGRRDDVDPARVVREP